MPEPDWVVCDPPYALEPRRQFLPIDYTALEVRILKQLGVLETPYNKGSSSEKLPRTKLERLLGPDPY